MTTFVGRRQEAAEIRRRLGATRLLTVTGPGGVGKTRLALEVAATLGKAFPNGVWLVDLASARDLSTVVSATAAALAMPDMGTKPMLEQLAGYLADRRALIVLDNCEHLVDACAHVATELLSASSDVRILATSRQMLRVGGEHVLSLGPLRPEEAADLLGDRTASIHQDFRISDANRAAVTRLCAGLDGMPLAIELVAARLRTLTVEQVVSRLEDRFALLSKGSRTAPARQRTLRAAIDWSYELCGPAEQLLWNRLSVFADGFTLDAAEAVCGGEGVTPSEVLDLLDQLVVQSVVLPVEAGGAPRYRLLETIRHYGRERLAESGEEARLRIRHRDFFLALAERVAATWFGPDQVASLAQLRAEHGNLQTALACDDDPQATLALAVALRTHWCVGAFLSDGRHWLDRALAAVPEPTPDRGQGLWVAVWLALGQGDPAAAESRLREAGELSEVLDDPLVRANIRGMRGTAALYRGQAEQALSHYAEVVPALRAAGEEEWAAEWQCSEAVARAYTGDPLAERTGREAIALAEAYGERWARAHVSAALAFRIRERGDTAAAQELVLAALDLLRGFNSYVAVAHCLELLAWLTAGSGDHERAARLLGSSSTLFRDIGETVYKFPQLAAARKQYEEDLVRALGQARFESAFAEGGRIDGPDQAVDIALDTGDAAPAAAPSAALSSPLTRREQQVAALVAQGMSNRRIAAELVLSPRTVDSHVERILAKLDVGNRAQIAAWWAANPVNSVSDP
ncbi:LuxR C-terminal-related transcriptional regulator [Streptomyces sp. NPDC005827]|uniref:ATP-binding protein n=1 Tax=Streptomyces sp. NPDC005827 TaxID=3157070 RepID=UPI0033FA1449